MDIVFRLFLLCLLASLCLVADKLVLGVAVLFGGVLVWNRFREVDCRIPAWTILGAVVPFASFFGAHTLYIFALLFLLLLPRTERSVGRMSFFPIVVVWGAWVGVSIVWDFDWPLLFRATIGAESFAESYHRLLALRHWWRQSPTEALVVIWSGGRFVGFFLFLQLLISSAERRREMARGVGIGLLPLVCICLSEHFSIGAQFPRVNTFWEFVGRKVGGFSDPNAFGVGTGVLFALSLSGLFRSEFQSRAHRLVLLFSASALIVFVLFSGSRSFFAFALVYLVIVGWKSTRLGLTRSFFFGGGVLVVVGLGVGLVLLAPESLPVSLARLARTLSPESVFDALWSRQLFWSLGLSVWGDAPLFGVGLGNFHDLCIAVADYLGTPLGLWSDNANSFYLEVLAECGLVGFVAIAWFFGRTRIREDVDSSCFAGSIAFVVILLFGPHLAFDEVVLLVALLLANTLYLSPRENRWPVTWGVVGLIVVTAIFVRGAFLERGFYPWEKDGTRFFRWTERRGGFSRWCAADTETVDLRFRSLSPHDVTLTLQSHLGESISRKFSPGEMATLSVQCDPFIRAEVIYMTFSVDPIWSPSVVGRGDDHRLLGIQELVDSPVETLPRPKQEVEL